MSRECIQVSRGTPWFDTVDQEHIPLEIINACTYDVMVDFEVAGLPSRETVYKSSNLKIHSLSRHSIEVITDKYYEALEVKITVRNEKPHIMLVEFRLR
ncbi:MAG: hypothetical protein QXD37_04215 [Zestosphaera sp.]